MKGKTVTYKDRVELITILNQLKLDQINLDEDIKLLENAKQKEYWGIVLRGEIFEIIVARAKHRERYPRLRGLNEKNKIDKKT